MEALKMNAKTEQLIRRAKTLSFCVDIDLIRYNTGQISEIELQTILADLIGD